MLLSAGTAAPPSHGSDPASCTAFQDPWVCLITVTLAVWWIWAHVSALSDAPPWLMSSFAAVLLHILAHGHMKVGAIPTRLSRPNGSATLNFACTQFRLHTRTAYPCACLIAQAQRPISVMAIACATKRHLARVIHTLPPLYPPPQPPLRHPNPQPHPARPPPLVCW
jgi:hypothetical protein